MEKRLTIACLGGSNKTRGEVVVERVLKALSQVSWHGRVGSFWFNRWMDRAIMCPRPQGTRIQELLAAVEGSTEMGDAEASPVRPSFTPNFAPSLA